MAKPLIDVQVRVTFAKWRFARARIAVNKIAKDWLIEAAKVTKEAAVQMVPVDTGNLKNSIHIHADENNEEYVDDFTPGDAGNDRIELFVTVAGARAPAYDPHSNPEGFRYGALVESRQPFMKPAVAAGRSVKPRDFKF